MGSRDNCDVKLDASIFRCQLTNFDNPQADVPRACRMLMEASLVCNVWLHAVLSSVCCQ